MPNFGTLSKDIQCSSSCLYNSLTTLVNILLFLQASSWQGTYDPDTERQKQMLKEDIKPLTAYPFVYIAISIFPVINR
jgi:hypothetical protein